MTNTQKFNRILIANRGEIACRIIQTAQSMGYGTVAVYSEADIDARHVKLADFAVAIGPAPASRSYLKIEKIIEAARATGAQAIHPGYGFLSEKAAFAEACTEAGIIFIGPSAEAIHVMGNKSLAKRRMLEAGVTCVPGYEGDNQDDEVFQREAELIGYPVMIKASAGGGGRGMRLVDTPVDLVSSLKAARSEAKNAFGDGTLLLEKAVVNPRHIEIQIFGDMYGNVIHLGERDCSIQRRHQKIIEESPSPVVDEQLRKSMGEAAVKAALAIGYIGAGTVEFLLDKAENFYFLEMNTRLQVEHPVTEMVTGLDLVSMQLDVAAGRPLPLTQEEVKLTGHAIEARLYAEDPARTFLPQTGKIHAWIPSDAVGLRTDHGLNTVDYVSPYYDPMIAKIIAHGADREEARRRLLAGLADTTLFGITTNKSFLADVLQIPNFIDGNATTAFLSEQYPEGWQDEKDTNDALCVAAALLSGGGLPPSLRPAWLESTLTLRINETDHTAVARSEPEGWTIAVGEARWLISLSQVNNNCSGSSFAVTINGVRRLIDFYRRESLLYLGIGVRTWLIEDRTYAPAESVLSGSDGLIRAPMNGQIRTIDANQGDYVSKGQALLEIEAMKMQHRISSPSFGKIERVLVKIGDQVGTRDILIEIAVDLERST